MLQTAGMTADAVVPVSHAPRRRWSGTFLALGVATLGLWAWSGPAVAPALAEAGDGARPTALPVPPRAPDALAGLELFALRCAECHGEAGRGDGRLVAGLPHPPRSFAQPEVVRALSPAEAFEVITHGRLTQGMPPWRDALSAQERWDVLYAAWSFYLSPDRLARGVAVWQAWCAGCHVWPAGSGVSGSVSGRADGGLESAAWPPSDHLSRSQEDWFRALREPGPEHAAVQELEDDTLWLALDAGRAFTFRALPHELLVPGGSIHGRVVNGTGGAGPAAGALVRAVALAGAVPGETAVALAAADGSFRLDNLVSGPELAYRVVTEYGGADYVWDQPVGATPAGEAGVALELTVYEAAADVPVVVRTGHLVLEPRPELGSVLVSEVWVVANETDRTLVTNERGGLRFQLPATAFDLVIEDARVRSEALLEGRTLVDRVPVPPGEREIVLRYHVPYWGRELRLERTIDMTTRVLQVLVPVTGATIVSPFLEAARAVAMEERTVVAARGESLEPGTLLAVDVGGLPRSAPRPGAAPGLVLPLPQRAIGVDLLAVWGVLVGVAGTLLALAMPLVRRGRGRASGRENAYAAVVGRIAALDRLHAAGRVAGDRYARERGKLLERAMRLAPDAEEPES